MTTEIFMYIVIGLLGLICWGVWSLVAKLTNFMCWADILYKRKQFGWDE
jgi:hypothetical protein